MDASMGLCGTGTLTPSERATVELVIRGLSRTEAAKARGVSVNTIANQLTVAYKKLGVASRRELCAAAAQLPAEEPLCRRPRPLSGRERQILTLAELGHANKVIAATVGLSLSTVSTLLTRGRRKADAGA